MRGCRKVDCSDFSLFSFLKSITYDDNNSFAKLKVARIADIRVVGALPVVTALTRGLQYSCLAACAVLRMLCLCSTACFCSAFMLL